MKKRRIFCLFLVMIIVAGLLLGCSSGKDKPADKKVYELTFAAPHSMESVIMSVANTAWKNRIEKESSGRIRIKFMPAEQAAKAPEHFDAARDGVVDIACQVLVTVPGRFPLTEVTQLPFIFDSPGAIAASLTTMDLYEKFPEIQKEYKGVKVLSFHATTLSHIHTVNKEVKTLEDLKRLLLNAAGTYGVATIQALGANAEMLPPGDKYDALAKGIVKGNVGEWEGQFSWKLGELTNYSTQADMTVFTFVNVMNLNTWNSLPPDLQALFTKEHNYDHAAILGYSFDKDDAALKQKLDEIYRKRGKPGVYILPAEEREKWRKAAGPVYDKWLKDAAAKVGEEKAKEILKTAQELGKSYKNYPLKKAEDKYNTWLAAGK